MLKFISIKKMHKKHFKMRIKLFPLVLITTLLSLFASAQNQTTELEKLPIAKDVYLDGLNEDWLIKKPTEKAGVFRNGKGTELILSNGIISRSFRLSPNAATTSLKVLSNQHEHIRAVKPEAVINLNGFSINVGGLSGQPNLAFLYPDWLDELTADPLSFKFNGFRIGQPEKRMEWKRVRHHAPDAEWPPKGVKLEMDYRLGDVSPIDFLALSQESNIGRDEIFRDDFTSTSPEWQVRTSNTHERSSFNNEGKPGEIYTPNNTAVFAEYKLPKGVGLVETAIDAGTDLSGLWGGGIALIWKDRTIKINMRPGNESGVKNKSPWRFTVFDGKKEIGRAGGKQNVTFDETWIFRIRIDGNLVHCEARQEKGTWISFMVIDFEKPVDDPIAVRVGKLGENASGEDFETPGDLVRLKIKEFGVYGKLNNSKLEKFKTNINELKDLLITVNYELYDGIPAMSKWITIKNNSNNSVKVENVISEHLGLSDHNPYGGGNRGRDDLAVKPNIHFETNYTFSSMRNKIANRHSVHWVDDQEYETQISWSKNLINVMKIYPENGYYQSIEADSTFESIRAFILPYDSYEMERNMLALRRMYRTIAPWVTENPIMFHSTRSGWEEFTNGVDQCAELGFEMLNFSFGSRINTEDESKENYDKLKSFTAYADKKGIKLGTYGLLASRRISEKDDVINPKTGKRGGFSQFNNSPCLCSEWGQNYFRKMYKIHKETGFLTFTHDGSYPGDVCASESHPGHTGLADSQYNQWKVITDFYKWGRGQGIYLRVPDFYFLMGANQTPVGYRENNWSLPRRQQLIHTRQNIYDGTWESTPTMRFSFVPLAQYHGGGAAATIEPLSEHLDHYEMMLVSNMGMGIQSVLRGPRLYDTEETKNMVERVVTWFKLYRDILESDLIHLRRADGRDLDYVMHVNPELKEKGFLLVFNPTDKIIKRKIKVPLYYTGLTKEASIREQEGPSKVHELNREYEIEIEVEVKPNWYNWYVVE